MTCKAKRAGGGLFLVLALLMGLSGCGREGQEKEQELQEASAGLAALKQIPQNTLHLTGQELARVYCGTCHQFPEPSLLSKDVWQRSTLPNMAQRLGLQLPELAQPYAGMAYKEILAVSNAEVFPDEPLISVADWAKIVAYYTAEAPEVPLPQDPKAEVKVGLSAFEARVPAFHRQLLPLTTLVRQDPANPRLYVGNQRGQLFTLDSRTLHIIDSLQLASPPVDIRFDREGSLDLLAVGSLLPADQYLGQWLHIRPSGQPPGPPSVLRQEMLRPVQFAFADLNQDGLEDAVVCNFGNHTGRLSWYETIGNGIRREHVLREFPGARRAIIHDLNGDGLPDIVALMTQGQEGLFAYYNQGGGRFREELLQWFPPVHGSSDFDLVDFDGDGAMDILYTNGDNADYSVTLKNYHGVRLFLNDGQNNFAEKWFYPLHGASRALAHDFDGDGDLDIATISFFPDFAKTPEESFVYFENQGNFQFLPQTFEASPSGRWLTLEMGDVDGDGDMDLILGSFIQSPTPARQDLQEKWQQARVPFLILQNKLKDPKPL